ncbi:MAG: hypothetical protein AB1454_04705 [Candidatus Auribacterota bacterium]
MKLLLYTGALGVVLLFTSMCTAASVPYSLSGTADLSVAVTTYHSSWPPEPSIDGAYQLNSGWWNPGTDESILFIFKSGLLAVDKIQIYSGSTTTQHTVERCHLFYTTDVNPTFSSTFLPLTNLAFLNSVNGVITGNEVYMNEAVNELLISFNSVEATAIRILDHSDGVGGDDERFYGRSIYSEVTIDEGVSGSSVPEPLTVTLLIMAVSGSIVKKVRTK